MQVQLGGRAAEALLHGALRGLADTLPPAAVPRVADVLAPLLHTEGWRAGLQSWAAAAIGAIPVVNGVPDDATRHGLLQLLVTLPDPFSNGCLNLDLIGQLRDALAEFARVCRRLRDAEDFTREAYDWVR